LRERKSRARLWYIMMQHGRRMEMEVNQENIEKLGPHFPTLQLNWRLK
jgi:hypothetical protein